MTITDRTRKILWVKAGGRCSLCRAQLVTEGTDIDDPSVFGEEAHIVAKGQSAPRAGKVNDTDAYANLILLCRKHHKQIDDQVGYYTVDRLGEIKRTHEERVASHDNPTSPGPVRLITDPTRPLAKIFKLFTTGTSLWNFVDGAYSFQPSWPDDLSDEDEDLIIEFLDELRDWIDISGNLSFKEKRNTGRSLGEHIKALAGAGYFVGARERFLLLAGGVNSEPSSWRSVDIEIQPPALAQLVNEDGSTLQFNEAASPVSDDAGD